MLIIGLVWHVFRVRRRKKQWSALAADLGLEADDGGLKLRGDYRGYQVSVWIVTRGGTTTDGPFVDSRSGNKRFYTAVRTDLFAPLPIEIEVKPEGIGSKLRKAVGKGDVELGDPDFDGRFWIAAEDAAAASHALHPEVRSELRRYSELDDDFTLDQDAIVSVSRGYAQPERLLELFEGQNLLVETIRRIAGARG